MKKEQLNQIKQELLEGLDRELTKIIEYATKNNIDIDGIELRLVCERWAKKVVPYNKRKFLKRIQILNTLFDYLGM